MDSWRQKGALYSDVDMFRLNSVLEELLTTSQGICPTRRELFGQLYEELIRQEMISNKVTSQMSDVQFNEFFPDLFL